jgi:DNA replication and repair protein RecF
LLTALRTSVFMPEDLYLIRGAATERRTVLDDAVVALDPARHDLVGEVERVVRQRNSLLKDLGPRPSANALASLDAWDDKLATIGDELGRARAAVVDDIAGRVQAAYAALAGDGVQVMLNYAAPWRETGLSVALREARDADLRRGTSTVGPHRDDLVVSIDALAARTQGSHGEQHSLGLALRMGIHHAVSDRWGSPPVLVLDDVLAGLDSRRKAAVFEQLLVHLPTRQVLVTSPEALPDSPRITRVLRVVTGTITDVTPEG